jgi:hypothetical protein
MAMASYFLIEAPFLRIKDGQMSRPTPMNEARGINHQEDNAVRVSG